MKKPEGLSPLQARMLFLPQSGFCLQALFPCWLLEERQHLFSQEGSRYLLNRG